jgi:hypothetical protein
MEIYNFETFVNENVRRGDTFEVIEGYNNRPFELMVGTDVRSPYGGEAVSLPKGHEIEFESEAPNGNIWFSFEHPESGKKLRGKIEAGSIQNLIRGKKIKKV